MASTDNIRGSISDMKPGDSIAYPVRRLAYIRRLTSEFNAMFGHRLFTTSINRTNGTITVTRNSSLS